MTNHHTTKLTASALAMAVVSNVASAQITATLSGTLSNSNAGPDIRGMHGASFQFNLAFANGATWGTSGSELVVPTASSSLTISGAIDPLVNVTAVNPGDTLNFFYVPGNGTRFGDDDSTDDLGYFFSGVVAPSEPNMEVLIALLEPSTTPADGSLLILDHFGAFDSSNTELQYIDAFGPGANAQLTEYVLLDAQLTVVPEPTSLALLGLGGLLVARRRRG